MSGNRLRLLICSQKESFLSPFIKPLSTDFEVQVANTEAMALFLSKEWSPQVALIDASGPLFNAVKGLRQQRSAFELGLIGLVDVFSSEKEKRAFELGADQFLVTPEDYTRLQVRVQALSGKLQDFGKNHDKVISLPQSQKIDRIEFGGLSVYPKDFVVRFEGKILNVTPTQFRLLHTFVANKDQLLSRGWLKEVVWGNTSISPRSIDAHISKLKKVVPVLDRYLMNVYGKGYLLSLSQKDAA